MLKPENYNLVEVTNFPDQDQEQWWAGCSHTIINFRFTQTQTQQHWLTAHANKGQQTKIHFYNMNPGTEKSSKVMKMNLLCLIFISDWHREPLFVSSCYHLCICDQGVSVCRSSLGILDNCRMTVDADWW